MISFLRRSTRGADGYTDVINAPAPYRAHKPGRVVWVATMKSGFVPFHSAGQPPPMRGQVHVKASGVVQGIDAFSGAKKLRARF